MDHVLSCPVTPKKEHKYCKVADLLLRLAPNNLGPIHLNHESQISFLVKKPWVYESTLLGVKLLLNKQLENQLIAKSLHKKNRKNGYKK